MSSLVRTSASALVLKRDSSEAASRLRSRQLAGRSLHPASRQAGRPGTLPRAPSRSAPRGPHLRARPFAPAHDAAPMRSLCGCGDYRRPAAEPRMGIPPAPHGSLRLPRPPLGGPGVGEHPLPPPAALRAARGRIPGPLFGPLHADRISACSVLAPARRPCSDVQPSRAAATFVARRQSRAWGYPLHPLARRLPRQSAARKRADTCRETRGLVRSVSRYVTSSPSHSGRHEELHPLFYALSLCK